jgi:protein-L-isoaspartate(D-aspartate) O-methyltransferase
MDYAVLRKRMVQEQLMQRGIADEAVLNAFYKVPREYFVPEALKESAYSDFPLPIGEGQTISQPYIVALMTERLALNRDDKILEIGTGSGYQAAILAQLCNEVYTVERFANLASRAKSVFADLGLHNIKVEVGDGSLGLEKNAPFDKIIITAAVSSVPHPLVDQLSDNGRMIYPLGESFSQVLTLLTKRNNKIETIQVCGCVFVPLVGKYGSVSY